MKKYLLGMMVAVFVLSGAVSLFAQTTTDVTSTVAISPCSTITQDLGLGNKGEEISVLQQYLIDEGLLNSDGPTGYFGRLTQAAAINWQKVHKISPANGFFDAASRAILNQLLCGNNNGQAPTIVKRIGLLGLDYAKDGNRLKATFNLNIVNKNSFPVYIPSSFYPFSLNFINKTRGNIIGQPNDCTFSYNPTGSNPTIVWDNAHLNTYLKLGPNSTTNYSLIKSCKANQMLSGNYVAQINSLYWTTSSVIESDGSSLKNSEPNVTSNARTIAGEQGPWISGIIYDPVHKIIGINGERLNQVNSLTIGGLELSGSAWLSGWVTKTDKKIVVQESKDWPTGLVPVYVVNAVGKSNTAYVTIGENPTTDQLRATIDSLKKQILSLCSSNQTITATFPAVPANASVEVLQSIIVSLQKILASCSINSTNNSLSVTVPSSVTMSPVASGTLSPTRATGRYDLTLTNNSNNNLYVPTNIGAMFNTSATPAGGTQSLVSMVQPIAMAGDTDNAYIVQPGTSRTFSVTYLIAKSSPASVSDSLSITAINYGLTSANPTGMVITSGLSGTKAVYVWTGGGNSTQPSISVNRPNAGQTFNPGQLVTIQYTVSNFPRAVNVQIQLNKGATYPNGPYNPVGNATSYLPATGTYTFTIPANAVPGNDYSFMINSDYPNTEASAHFQSSNFSVVSVTAQPKLTVNPSAGITYSITGAYSTYCGTDCYSFNAGSTLTLRPSPSASYAWTGCDTMGNDNTGNYCIVKLTADRTVKIAPVTTGSATTNTTNASCQTLWYYDTESVGCKTKQFCGAYMYQGLKTFESKGQCDANIGQATYNSAKLVSASNIPQTLTPGQKVPVSFTIKNTSSVPWTTAKRYSLGEWNPAGNSVWGPFRIILPKDVKPNEDVTFVGTLVAPTAQGTYPLIYRMVQDNVQWFGDYATQANIQVKAVTTSQAKKISGLASALQSIQNLLNGLAGVN